MRPLTFNIVKLGWVFLVLYGLILAGIFMFALSEGDLMDGVQLLLVTLVTQAIFIFCAGTMNLCKPIRRRRAFLPVVVTAGLVTLMLVATLWGLGEFIHGGSWDGPPELFVWGWIAINWIGWSAAFLVTHTKSDRFAFARKQVLFLIGGSLLQLMVMIPAHIITSRRPYCFAGMGTMIGIAGGLAVMLWAFGPGIALLFLKKRREA